MVMDLEAEINQIENGKVGTGINFHNLRVLCYYWFEPTEDWDLSVIVKLAIQCNCVATKA
jgi:hypothetical protein